MTAEIEEHPLPPDTLGDPPVVALPVDAGEYASSTLPPTKAPTPAP